MAFAKMLIFAFSFVGIFLLLFATIPGDFFTASYDASVGEEQAVIEYLSLNNVTAYKTQGHDNMTHEYNSLTDHPDAPQFPLLGDDQYLEVVWDTTPAPLPAIKYLECGHARKATFLFWGYWNREDDFLFSSTKTNIKYGKFLHLEDLITEYDEATNGSAFYARCSHAVVSIVYGYNSSEYSSLTDAWNSGELGYYLSYQLDFNATGVNAWNLLGQLLTFQNPDLGIGGTAGNILNAFIAIPLWIIVVILIILLVQSMIPFISGLRD
jgi:hypothetical protein